MDAVGFRSDADLLLEKVIEIGRVLEAKAKCDFGHAPVGMPEHYFGLRQHAVDNVFCGSFPGDFLQSAVKVVHMHAEPVGVILGSFQFELMLGRFDRKLAFEQFVKLGGQLRRTIHMHVAHLRRLHFHGLVCEHIHVVAHEVVLVHVVRLDIGLHFSEDAEQVFLLLLIDKIHGNGVAAKDRAVGNGDRPVDRAQKLIGKQTEIARLLFRQSLPRIGHVPVEENQRIAVDFDLLVAVGNFPFPEDQRDLVEVASGVGGILVAEYAGEYIKMTFIAGRFVRTFLSFRSRVRLVKMRYGLIRYHELKL